VPLSNETNRKMCSQALIIMGSCHKPIVVKRAQESTKMTRNVELKHMPWQAGRAK